MDFEWDIRKARENAKKHRVTFEEAVEVFADVHSSVATDPDSARRMTRRERKAYEQ